MSVTTATTVANKFSLFANSINLSLSLASITTAIPLSPKYLVGTTSKLISSPGANSPIATDTPPAPKSLHFLTSLVTSGFLNNLWIFLSSGAFPFCTSAPQSLKESSVCSLEEPVAPPQPSLPVFPPSSTTISPLEAFSLLTQSAGTAPTTAPTSILLALYPS